MTRREEITRKALELDTTNDIATFVVAARWADKTMIDKAVEWLEEYGDDFGVPESESGRVYVDDLVCEFRKAMEE